MRVGFEFCGLAHLNVIVWRRERVDRSDLLKSVHHNKHEKVFYSYGYFQPIFVECGLVFHAVNLSMFKGQKERRLLTLRIGLLNIVNVETIQT